MTTEPMIFMGKWTLFLQADQVLALDETTNKLCMQEAYPDRSLPHQRFNVYGDLFRKIWIQVGNGQYLTYTGDAYQACETRNGAPHYFCLEGSSSGIFYLADKGPKLTDSFYVAVIGGRVTRIPHTEKPDMRFRSYIYAVGVEEIRRRKEVAAPFGDLSHAYLAGADLAHIHFQDANLSHADLSNASLKQTFFQGSGTKMTGVNLSQANLQLARLSGMNLEGVNLAGAQCRGTDFGTANLRKAVMNGANLEGAVLEFADLTEAQLTGIDFTHTHILHMQIPGAVLKGSNLSGKEMERVTFDESTDFSAVKMQNVNLAGRNLSRMMLNRIDLTGAILDGADLTGADLSYANLSKAKVRNNAILHAAGLSNSILKGADFTGAQLGAKVRVFQTNTNPAEFTRSGFLTESIRAIFREKGCPLSDTATLTDQRDANRWLITDDCTVYGMEREEEVYTVWRYTAPSEAAVLAGAYMPDANFTNANLYAVNMAAVNWYGNEASAQNADMEEVNFSHANLSGMNLQQARMDGCVFDFAAMVGTNLRGAILRPSISNKPVSFVSANLQSADCMGAQLVNAVLTNAAISLNEGPYFTLDAGYGRDLDERRLSPDLIRRFTEKGYPLTNRAVIKIILQGSSWTIINEGNNLYTQYAVYRLGNELTVYGSVIGVSLFTMPEKMGYDLDAARLTDEIRGVFSGSGYPLVGDAKVESVVIKGKKWRIINEERRPKAIQTGYSRFYVLRAGTHLTVYAYALLIARLGDHNELQPFRYDLTETRLTVDEMNDLTTCPNGQKVEIYRKHPDPFVWERMMTANTPPHPPKCIPSRERFCPPPENG